MPACNSMETPTFGSHGYNGCLECLRWSFESQVFWSAPRKSVLGSIPSCSYVCSVSMVVSDNLVYYIMYANMLEELPCTVVEEDKLLEVIEVGFTSFNLYSSKLFTPSPILCCWISNIA